MIGSKFVEQRVDYLFRRLRDSQRSIRLPVELSDICHIQRIRSVKVHPIPLDGALEAIDLGFEVTLNGEREMQFEAGTGRQLHTLTRRQRFTLAHEIGHTLFYDAHASPPALLKESPKRGLLEHLCHFAARRILIPEFALDALFRRMDGISIDSIVEIEKTFDVSTEVALRRLQDFRPLKSAPVAIALAQYDASYDDASILAVFGGAQVKPIPPLFSSLRSWAGNWVNSSFWALGRYEGMAETRAHKIRVRKEMYSQHLSRFLVQFDFDCR